MGLGQTTNCLLQCGPLRPEERELIDLMRALARPDQQAVIHLLHSLADALVGASLLH